MPTTTGKPTRTEIAMKYGSRGPIPPDDPIFRTGWQTGSTVPYRQRPVTRAPSTGATIPENNRTKED